MLTEFFYAHGIWDQPKADTTIIIFNNLNEIKNYCENKINDTRYFDQYNKLDDYQILNKNLSKLTDLNNNIDYNNIINNENESFIEFTIGDDLFIDFTVSKIF
jgi:hypothetical protein